MGDEAVGLARYEKDGPLLGAAVVATVNSESEVATDLDATGEGAAFAAPALSAFGQKH